jgi:RHS repeat-associated protein
VIERDVYDPFGAQTIYSPDYSTVRMSSLCSATYGFQGMWFDSISGLNAADLRWYSPTRGLWTSLDPIGFAGRDVNLYRMEGSNPNNKSDPKGTFSGSISISAFILSIRDEEGKKLDPPGQIKLGIGGDLTPLVVM